MKLSKTFKSQLIEITETNQATGSGGWSSAFAEFPIYEGLYYSEITILQPKEVNGASHVRIGVGTKESNVELPIGSEESTLSYRDKDGCLMNSGKAIPFGENYTIGDTIGILVYLCPLKPKIKGFRSKDVPEDVSQKPQIIGVLPQHKTNDQLNLKGDQSLTLTQPKQQEDHSFVQFYKNGVNQGIACRSLKEGFYYVGVSLYMNARVQFEFGPNFKYLPNLSNENYVLDEDIVLKPYDLISKEQIPYNDIV